MDEITKRYKSLSQFEILLYAQIIKDLNRKLKKSNYFKDKNYFNWLTGITVYLYTNLWKIK